MYEYFEAQKEAKKALTSAEKKEIKAAKDKAEEKYTFCMWDGRKEKVGNFRIEPPGLFRGRGEHPKRGMLKRRVEPEQVTINIGKGAKVPVPPAGRKWGEVKHDNTVTWLAMWKENINGNLKYVMLAANSSLKGMSDFKKFEKARELKVIILAFFCSAFIEGLVLFYLLFRSLTRSNSNILIKSARITSASSRIRKCRFVSVPLLCT